jgi:hypothetical protein
MIAASVLALTFQTTASAQGAMTAQDLYDHYCVKNDVICGAYRGGA